MSDKPPAGYGYWSWHERAQGAYKKQLAPKGGLQSVPNSAPWPGRTLAQIYDGCECPECLKEKGAPKDALSKNPPTAKKGIPERQA